jgi:hypothetical protein
MTNFKNVNESITYPPTRPKLAIARLVHDAIGRSQQKRSDLLDQLGYKNKGKAARRLDAMLRTGNVCPNLVRCLPQALGIEPVVFQAAIEESIRQNEEHQKALEEYAEALRRHYFEPHIYVEIAHKKRPRSLFASLGTNQKRLRHIEVPPDLPREPQPVQVKMVGRFIRQFEGSEEYRSGLKRFSGPESYTYYPHYKTGWKFSVGGDFVGKIEE